MNFGPMAVKWLNISGPHGESVHGRQGDIPKELPCFRQSLPLLKRRFLAQNGSTQMQQSFRER
jgi:hypothetical protein